MATTVTKIIDPDNGSGTDYTSLSAWEAAQQGDLTGVRDEIAVAKCRCTGGTADTTAVTIDGWTTSATQYIKIWTDPSESYRHSGKWETGNKYRIYTDGLNTLITVREEYVRFEGLQLYSTGDYPAGRFFDIDGTDTADIRINGNIIVNGTGGYKAIAIRCYNLKSYIKIWNNVIEGMLEGIDLNLYDGTDTICFYNNTVISNDTGIKLLYGTVIAKNNIFNGCTTDIDDGSGGTTLSATYCATSNDNTKGLPAAGTGNRFSQTFSFVGAADFHLQSTDTGAKGYGLNLYNDAYLPFKDDIDGQDRGGSGASWDIGADEYVAAGNPYYAYAQQ